MTWHKVETLNTGEMHTYNGFKGLFYTYFTVIFGFPGGLDSKESAGNEGDPGPIPGWGRFPGEGNGNPVQFPCLGNPMDREAWWATVPAVTKTRTRLSD